MSRISVAFDELLPVKTAAQTLSHQLRRLTDEEVRHLIITTRNTPTAALITLERYEQLLEFEQRQGSSA